jgi:hypothetical protein
MAESIVIQGKSATLSTSRGAEHRLELQSFCQAVAETTVQGFEDEPNPDHVVWNVRCGPLRVMIAQLKPELRLVRWLRADSPVPFGPGSLTSQRQLATPYVILKVPFLREQLLPRVEVFYRTGPLRSKDGPGGALFFPNLFNVSPRCYDCISWFCTQYLPLRKLPQGTAAGLDAIIHHLWGGEFNASSEEHEGQSTFGLTVREQVDERVASVERWEAESQKDPRFVLSVSWLDAGLSVAQLIEREMKFHQITAFPSTVRRLGNLILRRSHPR